MRTRNDVARGAEQCWKVTDLRTENEHKAVPRSPQGRHAVFLPGRVLRRERCAGSKAPGNHNLWAVTSGQS